jgi:hypothetical protein
MALILAMVSTVAVQLAVCLLCYRKKQTCEQQR